jgi:hypothetical protein
MYPIELSPDSHSRKAPPGIDLLQLALSILLLAFLGLPRTHPILIQNRLTIFPSCLNEATEELAVLTEQRKSTKSKTTCISNFLGLKSSFRCFGRPFWLVSYFISFNILFTFTVKIAMAPCNSMPIRPEDDATSYPCLCLSSLFFASIL